MELYGTEDRSWAEHTWSLAGIALPQMVEKFPMQTGSVEAVYRQQRAIS